MSLFSSFGNFATNLIAGHDDEDEGGMDNGFSETSNRPAYEGPTEWECVWEGGVNVRDKPSTDGNEVDSLDYGEKVIATEYNDYWIKHGKGWTCTEIQGHILLRCIGPANDVLDSQAKASVREDEKNAAYPPHQDDSAISLTAIDSEGSQGGHYNHEHHHLELEHDGTMVNGATEDSSSHKIHEVNASVADPADSPGDSKAAIIDHDGVMNSRPADVPRDMSGSSFNDLPQDGNPSSSGFSGFQDIMLGEDEGGGTAAAMGGGGVHRPSDAANDDGEGKLPGASSDFDMFGHQNVSKTESEGAPGESESKTANAGFSEENGGNAFGESPRKSSFRAQSHGELQEVDDGEIPSFIQPPTIPASYNLSDVDAAKDHDISGALNDAVAVGHENLTSKLDLTGADEDSKLSIARKFPKSEAAERQGRSSEHKSTTPSSVGIGSGVGGDGGCEGGGGGEMNLDEAAAQAVHDDSNGSGHSMVMVERRDFEGAYGEERDDQEDMTFNTNKHLGQQAGIKQSDSFGAKFQMPPGSLNGTGVITGAGDLGFNYGLTKENKEVTGGDRKEKQVLGGGPSMAAESLIGTGIGGVGGGKDQKDMQISDLRAELEAMREASKAYVSEIESMRKAKKDVERRLTGATEAHDRLENELAELQAEYRNAIAHANREMEDFEQARIKWESEKQELRARVNELEEGTSAGEEDSKAQIEMLQQCLKDVNDSQKETQARLQEIQVENSALKTRVAELESQQQIAPSPSSQEELNMEAKETNLLRKQLEQQRADLERETKKSAGMQAEMAEFETIRTRLDDEVSSLNSDNAELLQQNKVLKAMLQGRRKSSLKLLENKTKEAEKTRLKLMELESKAGSSFQRMSEVEQKMSELAAETDILREDLEQKRRQCEGLETQLRHLQSQNAELQARSETFEEAKAKVCVLSDQQALEDAIEAKELEWRTQQAKKERTLRERLKQQYTKRMQRLENEKEVQHKKAKKAIEVLQQQVAELQATAETSEQEWEVKATHSSTSTSTHAEVQAQVESADTETQTEENKALYEVKLAELQQAVEALKGELEGARESESAARTEVRAMAERLGMSEEACREAQEKAMKVAELEDQATKLRSEMEEATQEIGRLREENERKGKSEEEDPLSGLGFGFGDGQGGESKPDAQVERLEAKVWELQDQLNVLKQELETKERELVTATRKCEEAQLEIDSLRARGESVQKNQEAKAEIEEKVQILEQKLAKVNESDTKNREKLQKAMLVISKFKAKNAAYQQASRQLKAKLAGCTCSNVK
mmetsp:Transcript_1531/g.2131  ORF Transcript_1531/g.2131 Transcript_1531/m.2131 type:complete len:1283 (-) Transcript_1531:92-3940(-)|eukprot:CAMPEP_0184500030 /NCGR_PEP_ID=MMETSP0113_2-20130426/43389_1 /TAXON_ID=91329 /ORGANISM="Norrisiella sphaerica, Strain BC52" /LENGTH=1282 /DNA_ID=CAMNT_0026888217 /DNA_START=165 /DNA_END=4013 /DNA_ORIENTATION=+